MLRPPAHVVIQFGYCLVDDGDTLTPGPELEPRPVPLADLRGSAFYERFMEDFARLADAHAAVQAEAEASA